MERRSRSNTESPSVFFSAVVGVFGQSKHLIALRKRSKVQSTRGAGQGQTKTFAPVNSHVRLETVQALYSFLTSHPPTLRSLLDTSGESLFCISHRSVLKSVFCRLSARLGSPDLDRCKRFNERAGNFHHLTPSESVRQRTWVALTTVGLWVGYSTIAWGFPFIMLSGDSLSGLT